MVTPKFQELASNVAETASVVYAFGLRHRPPDSEPVRTVKLSGATVAAFPLAQHEFAFVLPNVKFQSAGASWERVFSRPLLSSNRTTITQLGTSEDALDLPQHEFWMTADANSRLELRPFDLATMPRDCGFLYCNSALAYAQQMTERFQWAASLRGKDAAFELKRNALSDENTRTLRALSSNGPFELVELVVDNGSEFAPHEVTLSNLQYSRLRTKEFREELRDMLFENDKQMFDTNTDELPDEPGEWQNETVLALLKDRLQKWNSATNKYDATEEPHFRANQTRLRRTQRETAEDVQSRVLVNRYQTQSDEPEQRSDSENTHAFVCGTASSPRTSTLTKCKLSLFNYTPPPEASPKTLPEIYKRLADVTPDDVTGQRSPLFQRLRVLVASAEVRTLLKEVELAAKNNSMNEFVNRCARDRVLPHLVESIVVLKRVRDLLIQKADDPIHEIFTKASLAIEPYPKFQEALRTKANMLADDVEWIAHGGTIARTSVSISITTSNYGRLARSIPYATPASIDTYTRSLAHALCRLLYNPSPQGVAARFGV